MPASQNDRVVDGFWVLVKVSIAIVAISYIEGLVSYRRNREGFEEVNRWLETHASETRWRKNSLYDAGITRLEKLCLLTEDELAFLSEGFMQKTDALANALTDLKRHMVLKFWLEEAHLERTYEKFVNAGFHSLQSVVSKLEYSDLQKILENDISHVRTLWKRIDDLKRQPHLDFDSFPVERHTALSLHLVYFLWSAARLFSKIILAIAVLGVIACLAWLAFLYMLVVRFFRSISTQGFFRNLQNALNSGSAAASLQNRLNAIYRSSNTRQSMSSNNGRRNRGLWQSFVNLFTTRRANDGPNLPFNPYQTKFEFSWSENEAVVGEMRSFTVKFYSMFVIPCRCRVVSEARAEISVNGNPVPLSLEESSETSFLVKFTPTVAAPHKISFHAMGQNIRTFHKNFLPGAVDPSKSSVSIKSSTMVLKPYIPALITLDECDKFGNHCESSVETLSEYLFTVTELKDDCPTVSPGMEVTQHVDEYVLRMTLSEPGCYKAVVTHKDSPIGNNVFTMIVLEDNQWDLVMAESKKPQISVYYEAYLINDDNEANSKLVYIYLTPKQLFIKEWYWVIFSRRLHSMRVRTTLKLSVLPNKDSTSGQPLMTIQQPGKAPVLVACKDRDILIAIYYQLLLRKTGGSDNFESKRDHLYSELRKTYERKSNHMTSVSVNRANILKDSMNATKGFSDSDWGKQLNIHFVGEFGQDLGGPRREWFQVLSQSLFDPGNHFFCKSGKNDAQSLVHPNPVRPQSHKKLKYYEFAGKLVGKMMIECAFWRPHYVKARFSRAFLCQIIGLDVSWRQFESDDKELYNTKIQYLLNNDPEDLELTFTEDVYDEERSLIKTVELKPSGSQINVTESNKLNYLYLMADYRMAKCVKDEIASFKKGLHSLVSENLLSIFDENELELLISGTDHISPLDLKENFVRCAGGGRCLDKVLGWFWEIVFGMSQEEMARLLQFTTGSSQVPPGGFKELVPKFQINFHPGRDVLPTAHTCFNMLCLPDYSRKSEMQKLLFLALNEGSEGFGLV